MGATWAFVSLLPSKSFLATSIDKETRSSAAIITAPPPRRLLGRSRGATPITIQETPRPRFLEQKQQGNHYFTTCKIGNSKPNNYSPTNKRS
ncbi:hypothetical protein O3P69_002412 [Scylla paramamosain]|uniref:Secreted protein n=1 Tax=Scylla paramamosain TaxID=85552 RepID=A0AAW0V7R5_SCYPA